MGYQTVEGTKKRERNRIYRQYKSEFPKNLYETLTKKQLLFLIEKHRKFLQEGMKDK